MRHTLKAPGSKRVKLEYEKLLSNFAFDFNLRRYTVHHQHQRQVKHGPPPPPPPPPLPPPPPHHTKPKPTVVKAYALPEVTTVLASRLRFAARQFFQAADSGGHGDLTRGDTDAAILLAWGLAANAEAAGDDTAAAAGDRGDDGFEHFGGGRPGRGGRPDRRPRVKPYHALRAAFDNAFEVGRCRLTR